jgi:hypothetical protein
VTQPLGNRWQFHTRRQQVRPVRMPEQVQCEFGMFMTFDRSATWHRMKNGLPTVPVFDIQIHPRDHDLILATHGRGVWIMDNINVLEEMNSKVTSDLKLFDTRPAVEWKMADYRGFLGSAEFYMPNAPNARFWIIFRRPRVRFG